MQLLFSSASSKVLVHVANIKSSLRILVKIAKYLEGKFSLSLSLSLTRKSRTLLETSI